MKFQLWITILLIKLVASYETSQTSGKVRTSKIIEKQSPKKQVQSVEEVDFNQHDVTYVLTPNRYMVHKSLLDGRATQKVKGDDWYEFEFDFDKTIIGPPIGFVSMDRGNTDGTIKLTRSKNLGLAFSITSPSYSSTFLSFFTLSRAYSLDIAASVSISAQASCSVPSGKIGGLYVFEPQDVYDIKTTIWKKGKHGYQPFDEGFKQKTLVRTFQDSKFVCTVDEKYIEDIENDIFISNQGELLDYAKFI
ncbi:hypothetical protein CLIB1444_02S12530 [[Candida] jaroonii]|uniref:Uncharacterized protein n=1 Tax=[Candida] jaroonii TaxID=467808 RepID=A0ACA9Y3V8_9ASCO|nr:hypothetical protein CLIB1444_02S12530 [[Candida] jaroonii]